MEREGGTGSEARQDDQRNAGCIGRLRRREAELQQLLDGRPLSVEVAYASGLVVRVMMTPEGRVLSAPGAHFTPHVTVQGDDERVMSFLRGETTLLDALTDRLVTFGARMVHADDIPSYRAVWRLVTDELGVADA